MTFLCLIALKNKTVAHKSFQKNALVYDVYHRL